MAVFRIDKTRDYTVMANHHLRNKALSLKAKGLLSLMKELLTAKANIDRFLGTEEVHEEPDATKGKEADQR